MPSKKNPTDTYGGIGSEAIQAKTGKTWPEWLAALDEAGAQKLTHKEIVAVLHKKFGIGAWWQQMVTVGYEQARGLRAKHEMPDGYAISASKTLAVPIATAFKAWNDSRTRKKWLAEPITIRKATPGKSLRAIWADDTPFSVNFYPKGDAKCQVTLEHEKLANAKAAAKLKKFWGEKMEALKALVEK